MNPKVIKSNSQAEVLSICLDIAWGKKICFTTCYRVGTLGQENLSEIDKHINMISNTKTIKSHILIGDFNLNAVSWDQLSSSNKLQNDFLIMFENNCLTQLIKQPTHYLGNVLDILLTDKPSIISNLNIGDHKEDVSSDHFPISFHVLTPLVTKKAKHKKRKIYNFKKADWKAINEKFAKTDWNSMLDGKDTHSAWHTFKTNIFTVIDCHIPKITLKVAQNPPWFDSDLHKVCLKKERLRATYKEKNDPASYKKFCQARKELKNTVKAKMRANFENFDKPNSITKKFWSYVKSTSNTSRIPDRIFYEGKHANCPIKKATLFNEYFYKQFSEKSAYNIHIHFRNDQFENFKFTLTTVLGELRNIDANKAVGPDGIHGNVLKMCAATLAFPITKIFSLSFNLGQIPSDWKTANVVPVHKKGGKSNIENYRPISLTSLVMKVMEKIIRNELYNACQTLIHESQHGFLPGKSCLTQMTNVIDDISSSLNKRHDVDMVYFDFAKAFDSVNHDIILQKLKSQFKIDGIMLKFIKEYLRDRTQKVVIGDMSSSPLPVDSGVPQGSILGPLLFVLFINDIYTCVSDGTNIALYADDTKIWRKIISETDCILLNNDIDSLNDWAVRNKMRFHPTKCKILTFSLRTTLNDILPFQKFSYELGNSILDYDDSEKDLGVFLTPKLTWDSHHDFICKKASRQLGLLRRTCHFVKNPYKKRSLYIMIVRSLFEHCGELWAPVEYVAANKFEPIQKQAVKWITNKQSSFLNESDYHNTLKKLNLLPMSLFFGLKKLRLFHKSLNNIIPISFPKYITMAHNRRHPNGMLKVETNNKSKDVNVFSRSFFPSTTPLWNEIPIHIRQITCTLKFVQSVKEHMWQSIIIPTDELAPD